MWRYCGHVTTGPSRPRAAARARQSLLAALPGGIGVARGADAGGRQTRSHRGTADSDTTAAAQASASG